MKKLNWGKKIMTGTVVMAMVMAMTGCAANGQAEDQAQAEAAAVGTILLSVNPEIELEYDARGLVVEIEGKNEDGQKIIMGYDSFRGKDCQTVVNELVERIHEAGFFEKTVGGKDKNIVVKLEQGSAYPSDTFLENVAEGVRDAVSKIGTQSAALVVDKDDFDDTGRIGLEKAKELVLAQLGIADAKFIEQEYDLEDNVYEMEFVSNGVKYEFEVNAVNGKVLEADYEHNDDWNHKHNDGWVQDWDDDGLYDDDRYDDDRYDDDLYDDDRYDDDRYDDDLYDDDRYDDDRYDDDRYDDDRYDDDRYDDDLYDDDRYDDDRYDDDRYDDDRYDDDRYDDDRYDDDDDDDDWDD